MPDGYRDGAVYMDARGRLTRLRGGQWVYPNETEEPQFPLQEMVKERNVQDLRNRNEQLRYVTRVLELFEGYESDLDWRINEGEIDFAVRTNDVFEWGTADAEEITIERLPELEMAHMDAHVHGDGHDFPILYAARMRKRRPQNASYKVIDQRLWRWFDAVGPERKVDMFNPKERPAQGRDT